MSDNPEYDLLEKILECDHGKEPCLCEDLIGKAFDRVRAEERERVLKVIGRAVECMR